MSILTDFTSGKINDTQALTEVEAYGEQILGKLEGSLKTDPAVQGAVATLQTGASTVITDGVDWAGTALQGVASAATADLEALVAKYLPQVVGNTTQGAALSAGSLVLAQGLGTLLAAGLKVAIPAAIAAL